MRISLLLLFILPTACAAQVKDAGLWLSAGLKKRLSSSLSIELTQELRMNENVTEAGEFFTEAGISYKLKRFKFGGGYRYMNVRRLDDSYGTRHRYFADAAIEQKIGRIELTLRERYQAQYKNVLSSGDGTVPTYYLRSRLTFTWKTGRRYEPYVAGEVHYQLNEPSGNEFDSMRVMAGIDYDFNEANGIGLFYMHKREINVNDPLLEYITGIEYHYDF